ncbi:MAG: hypothetical protein KY468_04765 [Armatimonadetes bacterium]|nr:hypothetical protein [Armatimonadota bacterium]
MPPITSTEAAGFIPEIWLQSALGYLRNYLTLQKTVTKDTELSESDFRSHGDILHLPKRGALAANDKAEGAVYTVQNPSATTVDLTLNKHKEVTFMVESRAISTANQNFIGGYTEDAAMVLAEQIDKDLFTLQASVAAGQTITGGAAITEANILSARKILVDKKVPASQKKFGVVATSQTNALLQIERLTRWDALGVGSNIAEGTIGSGVRTLESSIGKAHGIEFAESQLVPVVAGAPSTERNLIYSKDAILFASRPLENPDGNLGVQASVITDPESGIALRLLHSYSHKDGGHLVTLDVLYGYTLMRDDHIVLLTTTA